MKTHKSLLSENILQPTLEKKLYEEHHIQPSYMKTTEKFDMNIAEPKPVPKVQIIDKEIVVDVGKPESTFLLTDDLMS